MTGGWKVWFGCHFGLARKISVDCAVKERRKGKYLKMEMREGVLKAGMRQNRKTRLGKTRDERETIE